MGGAGVRAKVSPRPAGGRPHEKSERFGPERGALRRKGRAGEKGRPKERGVPKKKGAAEAAPLICGV